MVSGIELEKYCSILEEIDYKQAHKSLKDFQLEDLKQAYQKGYNKSVEDYMNDMRILELQGNID